MSKRNLLRGLLGVVVATGNVFARAQKSPPPVPDLKAAASSTRPSQLTEPILARIENIEQKMVAIAELFSRRPVQHLPPQREQRRTYSG